MHNKFTNHYFFTKLDGTRRNPSRPVHIPNGSRIFLQMPGDHVLTGVLHLEDDHYYESSVFVQTADGYSLTANIGPLNHNSNHHNVQEYRCYLPLPDRSVLIAFLHPYNPQQDMLTSMSIFVRGPLNTTLFAGKLRYYDGYRPEWLP